MLLSVTFIISQKSVMDKVVVSHPHFTIAGGLADKFPSLTSHPHSFLTVAMREGDASDTYRWKFDGQIIK